MKKSNPYLLPVSLAIEAFILFGIAFVFMPAGWNMIPLLLIAGAVAALSVKLGKLRAASEKPAPEDRILELDEDDLKVMDAAPQPAADMGRRINRAFGPIAAGLIIDLIDFTSFGPIGLVLGLPLGGLVGYWMGRSLGLGRKGSLWCALAAGLYCMAPATEFIPLAMIMGACVRFSESGKRRSANEKNG
ncbi:hypothetical protein [Pontiella sulfatireligans]|uniref:Uncharacterized protein n=1 Tax=Pontiella sulfatireligans TaxID=2750658 RepID=A0A6C2UIG8_9BACT|nr:hypothetical protein [Pontiella sulfatireligans]VGO19990.1 hypothetical protein SCARR_02050 [Pontiella sulfatireligans]